MKITYSDEQNEGALESAGGIIKALPLLENETFLVVNGDVFCDYTFDTAFDLCDKLAHLILVENPLHNLKGDFGLKGSVVLNEEKLKYTFSGIGYYNPALFKNYEIGKFALAPILRKNIQDKKISGELFYGIWHDIGTPQRLKEINENLTYTNPTV